MPFTPSHRGGSGPPLVCLHGFIDTWRVWELVLPALERRHDVLVLTLPGHAGGFELAHLAGNSLGGHVALQLAARGRARTVVALAPAGGWAEGDKSYKELLCFQRELIGMTTEAAPHADAIVRTPAGRRRATRYLTVNYEHIPPELLAHNLRGTAAAPAAIAMIEHALEAGFGLDAERIACPVRVVWGTEDRLLPWPSAAARYRRDWLPHADWVELEGVGHCPQLDVPLETAQLILGFTGGNG